MQETQVRSLGGDVGHELATKPSPPDRREQRHGENGFLSPNTLGFVFSIIARYYFGLKFFFNVP